MAVIRTLQGVPISSGSTTTATTLAANVTGPYTLAPPALPRTLTP